MKNKNKEIKKILKLCKSTIYTLYQSKKESSKLNYKEKKLNQNLN